MTLDDEAQQRLLQRIEPGGSDAREALQTLYMHYRRPMILYFVHHGAKAEEAEDLFQDAFEKVLRNAHQYAGGSAQAWIWRVAKNHYLDRLRAARPEDTIDDEQWETLASETPQEAHEAQGVDRCVQQAMQAFAKVHPDHAWAVGLVKLEGWSIGQLAQHLGRTEGATREFVSQCRKKLTEFLRPCLEFLAG
jgi:RNA polymerase sigma factor (sigma-70 family)